MGFPLLLNKALTWGQEAWIGRLYKVDFVREGHVQSGQVGFPLLLNKALAESRSMDWTIVQGGLCKRGACSQWVSGLSLAAEQSKMDMAVLQVALF